MNSKYLKILALFFSLCSCCVSYAQKSSNELKKKLQLAETMINQYYVEPIDESKLVESAIHGMIKELDPYSSYQTAYDVEVYNEYLEGKFYGLGLEYRIIKDTLLVINTLSNSPAENASLHAGDKIFKINGVSIPPKDEDLLKLLRGPKNSKIALTLERYGIPEPFELTLKRGKIEVSSIDASFVYEDTGYIKLARFTKDTGKDFESHLKTLIKQGFKHLILDLRGNGGGLLSESISVTNQFLQAKQEIVSAKGNAVNIGSFYAKGNGLYQYGDLIVLVDSVTASASEIVAGALQDWDRALIIGQKTYGKGLVQRPIELPDNSRINLTIAHYYTPVGRCIQRFYKPLSIIDNYKGNREYKSNTFYSKILNKPINGGGGIVPDVMISSSRYFENIKDILEILSSEQFSLILTQYLVINKALIDINYGTNIDLFFADYHIRNTVLRLKIDNLLSNLKVNLSGFDRAQLDLYIKSHIASRVWDKESFYRGMFIADNYIKEALKILN